MNKAINEMDPVSPRRKPKRSKILTYSLLALLLIIVAIVIFYINSVLGFANKISDPDDSAFKDVEANEPLPVWEGKDRVNILLLGADARGLAKNEVPRSDSMIIASIDPVTKKATMFSVLRDTYAAIPGHDEQRINAALALGGPSLAMNTISDLTGLSIQYYVYTDFQGFIKLIDALGGIDFEVEKRMHYIDRADDPQYYIDLQPGFQHLDGTTALQYVRFRKDALSDFTRTERQRNFLTAVADKVKQTSSLIKLPLLLNSVAPYIETNMGLDDMVKLGRLGFDIDTTNIPSIMIPPFDLLREEKIGGADVISITDTDKLHEYVQEQLNPVVVEPITPDGTATDGTTNDGATSDSSTNSSNNTEADHEVTP
jgi:LCP family protein required for cell wall assembly